MTGHLRADLIRLGARWDVRAFVLLLPIIASGAFVAGYLSVEGHYGWSPDGPMPPEVAAQIAAEHARYAFPASILTALGNAPWVLFGLFFLVSGTIGLEFGWGTIRTALISAPGRGRLLLSRLVALGAIGGYALAALVAVGVVVPAVMRGLGIDIPPPPDTPWQVLAGAVAAEALASVLILAIGAFLAVLTRGPALPMLLLLVGFLLESILSANPLVQQAGLKQAAGSLPLMSVVNLFEGAQDPAAYGLPATILPPPTADRPLALSVAVVVGWIVVFGWLAVWRLRRLDVTE
jgi:ABC-2 type transport system permease protein